MCREMKVNNKKIINILKEILENIIISKLLIIIKILFKFNKQNNRYH